MKRVWIILMMVLLLAGCAARKEQVAEQTEPVAEFVKPISLYVPDSSIEQQTAGAVKVYEPQENCIGAAALDGKVVLVTDLSKLILMDSETGELGTAVKVGETISTDTPDFTASREGITYYREEGRELVFLSSTLRQEMTVEIPKGITGKPCVVRENQEVYYTKDNQLWAQHLQTGETRLVYGQDCQSIQPVAGILKGTILVCNYVNTDGEESVLYLDPVTGDVAEGTQEILNLQAGADQYLVSRKDGIVEQLIYGTVDGENCLLNLELPIYDVFAMNGGYQYRLADGVLELDFYDFADGTQSAKLRLENVTELLGISNDGKYFWILAKEKETTRLYRWDVAMSLTSNGEAFASPLYTRENPDVAGLEQCAQRAQELTDRYGIYITTEEDVSGGYVLTEEYQVPALNQMLDTLETVLEQFPEGFLQESLSEGSIHISLVREIAGGKDVVQFYEKGDAYIIVAATENFHQNLIRGLAYIIDSHVLGGSDAYDEWQELNPQDFSYDLSYYFYNKHLDSEYLTEEKRAFVDAYAMTFPHEDRSLLFAYAMMEDCGAYFTTDTMQAKLALICDGIRDAYSWYEEDFLWEQYLTE